MNSDKRDANGRVPREFSVPYTFSDRGEQLEHPDHTQPAGTAVASAAIAVTWTQAGVPIRENVFYQGANGNLIELSFG